MIILFVSVIGSKRDSDSEMIISLDHSFRLLCDDDVDCDEWGDEFGDDDGDGGDDGDCGSVEEGIFIVLFIDISSILIVLMMMMMISFPLNEKIDLPRLLTETWFI